MTAEEAAQDTVVEGLVEAARAGDRTAFDDIVRRYQRRAMQVAIRMLGSADEAAEAVQDAFVSAYTNIGQLKDVQRFEVWLLRIVANAAASYRRKARRRNVDCIASRGEPITQQSPVHNAVGNEMKDAVRKAMRELSEKEAKAIGLFGLEGLSQDEVAAIMDCSVELVRWYVFNARKKLKVLLKDYLE